MAEGLQNQLSEARRAKASLQLLYAGLEERASGLGAANASLQEELNKRSQAEKALTQRRRELESSKSVLELHVQARTEELETLQRRYEMILNSAGEGICGLDRDGRTTFANPTVAKLLGRPIEHLIGKTEAELFGHNVSEGDTGLSDQSPGEQIFHRQDGTCFPVEFVRTAITEDGRVIGSVLVFKDITERKRVEEALAQ
jgi:PAS domain S-box-containing protein